MMVSRMTRDISCLVEKIILDLTGQTGRAAEQSSRRTSGRQRQVHGEVMTWLIVIDIVLLIIFVDVLFIVANLNNTEFVYCSCIWLHLEHTTRTRRNLVKRENSCF